MLLGAPGIRKTAGGGRFIEQRCRVKESWKTFSFALEITEMMGILGLGVVRNEPRLDVLMSCTLFFEVQNEMIVQWQEFLDILGIMLRTKVTLLTHQAAPSPSGLMV